MAWLASRKRRPVANERAIFAAPLVSISFAAIAVDRSVFPRPTEQRDRPTSAFSGKEKDGRRWRICSTDAAARKIEHGIAIGTTDRAGFVADTTPDRV